eukprot:TRINITY_DN2954_c0_g1_i1.p1 TRINITY_DN2954_c0_g1~~TRINITY_DN2954_c0_g1_i1.p1  ORF type:complete len:470 (+),score=67.93 TRINITY_DN2954_c0_g1_i1:72-1412(+)
MRPFGALIFALFIGASAACTVTIESWHSSPTCQGASTLRTIAANNTCQFEENGEYVVALVRGDVLTATSFESSTCDAESIAAEPTNYVRGQCTELGGGLSAIASWIDSPQCVPFAEKEPEFDANKQISPCYFSDLYKLPGQSYQEFVCHEVKDGSSVVFEASSENSGATFSLAVFEDAEYQKWLAGSKALCVNSDCVATDSAPKFGTYAAGAQGSPYHIIVMNSAQDVESWAVFDLTVSVSVGAAVDVHESSPTGGPPPPPSPHPPPPPHPHPPPPPHPSPPPPHPPTPPPPHPPTPPPPHPPTPPPPHPPTPPPPHPPTPPPPHPPTPPPPHPPTPPPPHPPTPPTPPPPHPTPPPPPPPGPPVCAALRKAIPKGCYESPDCDYVYCKVRPAVFATDPATPASSNTDIKEVTNDKKLFQRESMVMYANINSSLSFQTSRTKIVPD